MDEEANPRCRISNHQLREAEEGLIRLLYAKQFPGEWIRESVPEIMAEARTDFAARLAVQPVERPVGLLLVIAYRRAIKHVRRAKSTPRVTSLNTVFNAADKKTSTPEEEALDHDQRRRLLRAIKCLPKREQRLIVLVYFQGMKLGEAGRRVGWAKASATRHHQVALQKLEALMMERA